MKIAQAFISFALFSLMMQVFYVFTEEIQTAGLAEVFGMFTILTAMLLVVVLVKLSEGGDNDR